MPVTQRTLPADEDRQAGGFQRSRWRDVMRLDKYLADMNAGTRKELKRDIRKGLVTVDGSIVKDPGRNVEPLTDTVCYRGRKIEYETYVYYMLNKPAGVISATDDKKMKTVVDLLPEERRRDIFPRCPYRAGRSGGSSSPRLRRRRRPPPGLPGNRRSGRARDGTRGLQAWR